jgi:hypothetical protein
MDAKVPLQNGRQRHYISVDPHQGFGGSVKSFASQFSVALPAFVFIAFNSPDVEGEAP